MPNKKKNIKVRDLKPNKDAKGGGGFKPQGGPAIDNGPGKNVSGGTAPSGTNPSGGPANS